MNINLYILRYALRLLPFAYMALIWFLSSNPSDAFVNTGLSFDRALKESLHLIEFGILYFFLVMAWLTWRNLTPKASYYLAFFSAFYGLTDEIHQYFVPSRSATATDLLKDLIGVIITWYIIKKAYWSPLPRGGSFLKKFEATVRMPSKGKLIKGK